MNVSIDAHFEEFVQSVVRSGRYGSPDEVIHEGLKLVEEREAKLQALREHLNAAIERGGSHTSEDVAKSIERTLDGWEADRRTRR